MIRLKIAHLTQGHIHSHYLTLSKIYKKRIGYTKSKKSLKIPKGQSESAYRRRTDTTMGGKKYKWTNNDLQNLHIKLKIE
jgi:hypothetical protein